MLMHMRGSPADMYAEAGHDVVVRDVRRELSERIAVAERAGIRRVQRLNRTKKSRAPPISSRGVLSSCEKVKLLSGHGIAP